MECSSQSKYARLGIYPCFVCVCVFYMHDSPPLKSVQCVCGTRIIAETQIHFTHQRKLCPIDVNVNNPLTPIERLTKVFKANKGSLLFSFAIWKVMLIIVIISMLLLFSANTLLILTGAALFIRQPLCELTLLEDLLTVSIIKIILYCSSFHKALSYPFDYISVTVIQVTLWR